MLPPHPQQPTSSRSTSWLHSIPVDLSILCGITLLGTFLRWFGVNHGNTYHPDERHMIMVTGQLEDNGMNPKSFAYGSFSFYALWIFARLGWAVWSLTGREAGLLYGFPDPTGYDGLLRMGRILCLLMGVISIPLIYLLAVKIYKNSIVGLIAATLLAVNVFHIQLSRFFTSDITLSTLCLVSIIALVSLFQSGSLLAYITLGLFLGLSTATKISSVFLASPLLITVLLVLLRDYSWIGTAKRLVLAVVTAGVIGTIAFWSYSSLIGGSGIVVNGISLSSQAIAIAASGPLLLLTAIPLFMISPHLGKTALALSIAGFVFTLAEPFAVLDFNTFLAHTNEQTSMVQGKWRPPYTIQYEATTPYLYHLKQMLWYTMGVPVFLLVTLGVIASASRSVTQTITALMHTSKISGSQLSELIPLIFVVVFFVATAGFQVKFPRYLMPTYPLLFMFAASLYLYTSRSASSPKRGHK